MEHWMNHGLVLSLVKLSEWRSLQLFQWFIFSLMAVWLARAMRYTSIGSNIELMADKNQMPSKTLFPVAQNGNNTTAKHFFLCGGVTVHISTAYLQQGSIADPQHYGFKWEQGQTMTLSVFSQNLPSGLNMWGHASPSTCWLTHWYIFISKVILGKLPSYLWKLTSHSSSCNH